MSMTERTTQAQRAAIRRLLREHGAESYLVEFDEDHDEWCFLTLFHDRRQVYETIVEPDGSEAS